LNQLYLEVAGKFCDLSVATCVIIRSLFGRNGIGGANFPEPELAQPDVGNRAFSLLSQHQVTISNTLSSKTFYSAELTLCTKSFQ
jgi:hypothetical protein